MTSEVAWLRIALDGARTGVLVTDDRGTILVANAVVESWLGYGRSELTGSSLLALAAHGAEAELEAAHRATLEDGRSRILTLQAQRRDGLPLELELHLAQQQDGDRRLVVAAAEDLTPRRRLEARFRAVIDASPSGLLMIDREGVLVLANPEVERMFGYGRGDLLGRSIDELLPERYRRRHSELRERFLEAPSTRSMGIGRDLRGLRRDGTEFPIEIGLNPLVAESETYVVASIADITARRAQEERLRRLEERLSQAQRVETIGLLAGGVAHDVNNVLGAIVGYAELLEPTLESDAAKADLTGLVRAAERGRDIVERILAFGRPQEQRRRPLLLAHVVEEVLTLLRATLPGSIEVAVRLGTKVPPILGEATALHQILMNLATNAWQAMPSGGTLTFELEGVTVDRSRPGDAPITVPSGRYAVLTARDEGVGMEPDVLARVFEPFFTTKTGRGGSGLGLSIVEGLVRKHDGHIRIESTKGVGTSVRCWFPALLDAVDVPTHRANEGEMPRGSGERLLLVDDETSLASVTKRRLESIGYEVVTADRAARALDLLAAGPFDLVITDESMPQMNGIALAEEIDRRHAGLPVFLLTGFVEPAVANAPAKHGLRRILKKPITLRQLAHAIAETLRGGS